MRIAEFAKEMNVTEEHVRRLRKEVDPDGRGTPTNEVYLAIRAILEEVESEDTKQEIQKALDPKVVEGTVLRDAGDHQVEVAVAGHKVPVQCLMPMRRNRHMVGMPVLMEEIEYKGKVYHRHISMRNYAMELFR